MNKDRDFLFDNTKALMLLLVAVGHILDVYIINSKSFFRYAMQYIYLFHMPMFAFITGYFSKNLEKQREKAVKSVLMSYLIIQSVYCVLAKILIYMGIGSYNANVFSASLLLPTSPLYYLLCVFFWKVFAKDILKLRYPFVISIIVGSLVSITQYKAWHVGLGATFTLLPFFVLGIKCSSNIIEKIRNINKFIPIMILFIGVIPSVFLPYCFRNIRFSYSDVGISNVRGIIYRLLFYAVACAFIVALVAIMPRKKTVFSKIGTNALMVYAGSSFLAPHGYVLLAKIIPIITQNTAVNFGCIIVYSVIIVYCCSLPIIMNTYIKIQKMVGKILFRKEGIL